LVAKYEIKCIENVLKSSCALLILLYEKSKGSSGMEGYLYAISRLWTIFLKFCIDIGNYRRKYI